MDEADLVRAFGQLNLAHKAVVAHASLRAFGWVDGGAEAVISALLRCTGALVMPTHTYKPMFTPQSGPPNNGMDYQSGKFWQRNPELFTPAMPVDVMMGVIPEALRKHPRAMRSMHPILSFAGVNAEKFLRTQTLANPFAPLLEMANDDGWVLLIGVNHTVNTTMHVGEQLARRKPFIRWALTEDGIVTCPGFPGCSAGFESLEPTLRPDTIEIQVGQTKIRAISMRVVIRKTYAAIKKDPLALLCKWTDCERCTTNRQRVAH